MKGIFVCSQFDDHSPSYSQEFSLHMGDFSARLLAGLQRRPLADDQMMVMILMVLAYLFLGHSLKQSAQEVLWSQGQPIRHTRYHKPQARSTCSHSVYVGVRLFVNEEK